MDRSRRYAAQTKVGADRSRSEIEKLLMRFGAGQFGYMTDAERNVAHIMFVFRGMRLRITVTLPARSEMSLTKKGRPKKENVLQHQWEKETRRRWRSLCLLVKAKLVAVEDGVATFEEEFLPYIMWGDGRTTAEQLAGKIAEIEASGVMPNLLSMPGDE